MVATLRRSVRALVALGLAAVVFAPAPAFAGDPPPSPSPLRAAIAAAGPRVAVPSATATTAAPRRSAQPAANPAMQSPTFFRTRTGVIVLGVLAAGAGYAIYSTQHDRIHSAGKQ